MIGIVGLAMILCYQISSFFQVGSSFPAELPPVSTSGLRLKDSPIICDWMLMLDVAHFIPAYPNRVLEQWMQHDDTTPFESTRHKFIF